MGLRDIDRRSEREKSDYGGVERKIGLVIDGACCIVHSGVEGTKAKINSIEGGQSSLDHSTARVAVCPLERRPPRSHSANHRSSRSPTLQEIGQPPPWTVCHGPGPGQASLKLQKSRSEITPAASTRQSTTTGFCQHRQHGRTKAHVGEPESLSDLSQSQLAGLKAFQANHVWDIIASTSTSK